MAVPDERLHEVAERLLPLGDVAYRRMFGGVGFFQAGDMFALLSSDGTLYFKTDEDSGERYREAGSEPFAPQMGGRRTEMPYHRVPDAVWDDGAELAEWAVDAMAVAHAAKDRH